MLLRCKIIGVFFSHRWFGFGCVGVDLTLGNDSHIPNPRRPTRRICSGAHNEAEELKTMPEAEDRSGGGDDRHGDDVCVGSGK